MSDKLEKLLTAANDRLKKGLCPNPMAARMMAHTEVEHNQTYQRWINQEQEDKFYRVLMEREDRPQPPKLG